MANRLGCLIGRHRRSAVREVDGRAFAQCPDCGEMLIRRRFGWGAVLPNEAPEIRRLRRAAEPSAPPPARPQPPAARVVGIAVPGEEMVAVDPLGSGPIERPAGLPSWVITGAWPVRDGAGARRIEPGHRLDAPPRRAALPGTVGNDPPDPWREADPSDQTIDQPMAAPEATVDGGAAVQPVEPADAPSAPSTSAPSDPGGAADPAAADDGAGVAPEGLPPTWHDPAGPDEGDDGGEPDALDPLPSAPATVDVAAAAAGTEPDAAQPPLPAVTAPAAPAPQADGSSWAAMMAASRPAGPTVAQPPALPPAPPAEPAAARPAPPIVDPLPAPPPARPEPAAPRSPSDLAAVAIQRLHGSAAGAHALARLALAHERGDAAGVAYWQGIAASLAKQVVPGLRAGR